MGLYGGAVDRMGIFSADSMRACRLVVDTGLHALGWSRQHAVDYLVANSPLTEGVCRPEIDRYILHPGQATSYMIGRLEILRMRAEAHERQGDAVDLDMTLIDTAPGFAATLEVLADELGVAFPTAELAATLGAPLDQMLGPYLPAEDIAGATDRFRALYPVHAVHSTPHLRGAPEA